MRAKGEHPLLVLKQIFGFRKVRYRGIHKNANRLFVACGLVNLYMVRRRMLALAQGQCARRMANERTGARKAEINRPSSGENDPPVTCLTEITSC